MPHFTYFSWSESRANTDVANLFHAQFPSLCQKGDGLGNAPVAGCLLLGRMYPSDELLPVAGGQLIKKEFGLLVAGQGPDKFTGH